MTQQGLELLTCRLQPGVTPDACTAIFAATAPALEGCPGIPARDLAVIGDDGTGVIRRASQAHADAAGPSILSDPEVAPLMATLDLASLTLRNAAVRWHKSG